MKTTLNKSGLVGMLQERVSHLPLHEVDAVVSQFFEVLGASLADKLRVELRGFGVFDLRHRRPRQGRNPRTGQTVFVEGKWVPYFKAGKGLRRTLSSSVVP